MSEKIIIVSPPDDILEHGIRFLFVDLQNDQSQLLSNILLGIESRYTIINYVWQCHNPKDWLFDKILKSDYIFFNADSQNQLLVGYLSSKKNSSYFGNLRDLNVVNNSVIISADQCKTIFNNIIQKYE